jgi:hypothetical protein
MMKSSILIPVLCMSVFVAAVPAKASSIFDTGSPDGLIASASRPGIGSFEIETADDFILSSPTSITSATFTGLVPTGATVTNVVVEIYRVFPADSDVGRTSGPPTFSTTLVPTRVNSPSDVALDSRDSSVASSLNFSTSTLQPSFTANNSVQPGGIHPKPNQTTLGNGPVTGQEVLFNVTFIAPFMLTADHYFFVPQVQLDNGDFLWLSAPRPITGGSGPFNPDLQGWARDQFLDPDWLRVGTDIVGTGAFNFAFSLDGTAETPLPAALPLFASGAGMLGLLGWRRKRKIAAKAG